LGSLDELIESENCNAKLIVRSRKLLAAVRADELDRNAPAGLLAI
jgi:hypothetical protein